MVKPRLLTPGPVAVPERVARAMTRPIIHHRSSEFVELFKGIRADLQYAFQTQQEVCILACSGTGAMEAALCNLLSPRDRVVVVRGGKFGDRWAELCTTFGVDPICIDVEWGRAVDPADVRKAFDHHPDAKGLLVQASETSTGVFHPVRALAQVVHMQPDRLLIVDAISAVAVHELRMDEWGIDALISASQKALSLPPGLGFVALSSLAQAALSRSRLPKYYFDLARVLETQRRNQTPFTPPISLLYGLAESLKMIVEEGIDRRVQRHEVMARVVRGALSAMGLELLVNDSHSFACTAVRVPDGIDGKVVQRRILEDHGIRLAGGQGRLKGKILRMGHLGDLDVLDMIAAISAIETALAALGYPVKLGEGVRAATELNHELGFRGDSA